MQLNCDNCKSLKCKQAEDDCKGFMDAAGKWIGKALSSVSLVACLGDKTDSAKSPSNKWKHYVLKIFTQHGNFWNTI